jgi:hypothetical protein
MATQPRQLFRQEAIDAQREKLLGEVSLARPVPLSAFTAVAVAFALALVGFSMSVLPASSLRRRAPWPNCWPGRATRSRPASR